MKFYLYNKKSLKYERIPLMKYGVIILSTTFLIGLLTGSKIFFDQVKELEKELSSFKEPVYKGDFLVIKNEIWEDSVFTDYAIRAQMYLDRPESHGTPLTGEMMALAARNAYDSTGILLPVELALSQAIWESSLGRRGRSPKNNPWNIGEYDTGTVMWFNSTFEGTQAYYYWMCRTYLSCRTVEELLVNFVNCSGYRYAKIGYEEHIYSSYVNIKRWLDNNIKHRINL